MRVAALLISCQIAKNSKHRLLTLLRWRSACLMIKVSAQNISPPAVCVMQMLGFAVVTHYAQLTLLGDSSAPSLGPTMGPLPSMALNNSCLMSYPANACSVP